MSETSCGSTSRMPGSEAASVRSWVRDSLVWASYSATVVSSRPNAERVAAMFLPMYGASLSGSSGLTWNRCISPGHTAPSSTAETANSASPTPGSSQVRRRMLAKNSSAQMTAMNIKMFFEGSTAWSRV